MAAPRYLNNNRPSGVYENGKLVESDKRPSGVYENGKLVSTPRAQPKLTAEVFKGLGPNARSLGDASMAETETKNRLSAEALASGRMGSLPVGLSFSGPPPITAPSSITAPTPKWQQDITKKYRGIGEKGTPENEAYVAEYKDRMSSKQPFDTMELADDVMGRFVPNTGLNTSWAAPAPTVQSGMYSGKMPEQRPALPPLIAKTDPYGTMLNDRPGGGRTYESPFLQPRPMGSGTLSQRPTSTASGASERVAARRAIRMNPKSTEEDRRFARGIGGARNSSYGNYD